MTRTTTPPERRTTSPPRTASQVGPHHRSALTRAGLDGAVPATTARAKSATSALSDLGAKRATKEAASAVPGGSDAVVQ